MNNSKMIPANEFLQDVYLPEENKNLDESSRVPASEYLSSAYQESTQQQQQQPSSEGGLLSKAAPITAMGLTSSFVGGTGSMAELAGKGAEVATREGIKNTVNDLLESQGKKGDFDINHPGVTYEDLVRYFGDQEVDPILPQVILPTIGSTYELLNDISGKKYEPKTVPERYLLAGSMGLGAALNPLGGGIAAIPGAVGGALAGQTAAELGLGEGWQFLAGILGGGITDVAKRVVQSPKKTVARGLASVLKADTNAKKIFSLMPEARASTLVEGAGGKALQGIEAIISKDPKAASLYEAQSRKLAENIGKQVSIRIAKLPGEVKTIDSLAHTFERSIGDAIQEMETQNNKSTTELLNASKDRETQLSTTHSNREKYEGKAKGIADSLFNKEAAPAPVKNELQGKLEQISPREDVSKATFRVKKALEESEASSKQKYTELYQDAEQELKGKSRRALSEDDAKVLDKELGKVLSNISGSKRLEHAPAEFARAIAEIKSLKSMARGVKEGRNIYAQDLINASKRLNDIFYSTSEGYSRLVGLARDPIENAISKWSSEHAPEYLAKRKEANKAFMQHKKVHGGETVRRARRGEKYENIASGAGKESVHDLLTKALEGHHQGKEAMSGLKRISIEKNLGEMVRETDPRKIARARDKLVAKIEGNPTLSAGEKKGLIDTVDSMAKTAEKGLQSTPDARVARAWIETENALKRPHLNEVDRQSILSLRKNLLEDMKESNPRLYKSIVERVANSTMRERLEQVGKGYAKDADIVFRKRMKTQEGVREVRDMLKGVKGGEKIIQDYAKTHIESELQSAIDTETGSISPKKLEKAIEKMQNDPYYKELVGEENVQLLQEVNKSLEDMQKLVQEVSTKQQFGVNPSGTAHMLRSEARHHAILASVASFFTGNVTPLVGLVGARQAARVASKLLTDPAFKRQLVKAMQPPKTPAGMTAMQRARKHQRYLAKSAERVNHILQTASVSTEPTSKKNIRD